MPTLRTVKDNGLIVHIDLDQAWLETFAAWEVYLPTHVAKQIAIATAAILEKFAETEEGYTAHWHD